MHAAQQSIFTLEICHSLIFAPFNVGLNVDSTNHRWWDSTHDAKRTPPWLAGIPHAVREGKQRASHPSQPPPPPPQREPRNRAHTHGKSSCHKSASCDQRQAPTTVWVLGRAVGLNNLFLQICEDDSNTIPCLRKKANRRSHKATKRVGFNKTTLVPLPVMSHRTTPSNTGSKYCRSGGGGGGMERTPITLP